MNANPEAMTLERVSREIRQYADNNYLVAGCIRRWADAIDAHLRAAEPGATRVHVVCCWNGNVCEFIEVEDDSGCSVSIPWTAGKDGYSELILYTHPSADALDAKRFKWWFNYIARETAAGIDAWRVQCDAAMAEESGNV